MCIISYPGLSSLFIYQVLITHLMYVSSFIYPGLESLSTHIYQAYLPTQVYLSSLCVYQALPTNVYYLCLPIIIKLIYLSSVMYQSYVLSIFRCPGLLPLFAQAYQA